MDGEDMIDVGATGLEGATGFSLVLFRHRFPQDHPNSFNN